MRLLDVVSICVAFTIFTCAGVQAAQGKQEAAVKERTIINKTLEPKDAYGLIKANKSNPDFVIIDVRTPEEFQSGHIEGAKNINYYADSFEADLDKLDKKKTYIVYCRTGRRSSDTANIMLRQGFTQIYRIAGDIVRWKDEGLPVVK